MLISSDIPEHLDPEIQVQTFVACAPPARLSGSKRKLCSRKCRSTCSRGLHPYQLGDFSVAWQVQTRKEFSSCSLFLEFLKRFVVVVLDQKNHAHLETKKLI